MINELLKCPDCDLRFNTQGGLDRHLREIDKLRNQQEVNDALATIDRIQTEVREQTDENGVALPGSKLEKDLNLPTKDEVERVIFSASKYSVRDILSEKPTKAARFARLKERVEATFAEEKAEKELKELGDTVENDLNELVSVLQPPPPVVANLTPAFAAAAQYPQFFEPGGGVPIGQYVTMYPATSEFRPTFYDPVAQYNKYMQTYGTNAAPYKPVEVFGNTEFKP